MLLMERIRRSPVDMVNITVSHYLRRVLAPSKRWLFGISEPSIGGSDEECLEGAEIWIFEIFTPLRGRVRPHQGYKVSYVLLLVVVVVVVVVLVLVVVVLLLVVVVVDVDVDVDVDDDDDDDDDDDVVVVVVVPGQIFQVKNVQKHCILRDFCACKRKHTGIYDVFAA